MTLTPLRKNAVRSCDKTPTVVRMRADLVTVQTRHRNDSAVVVKDPIAMKYHRMRPDEYFVLSRLDTETTLQSLQVAYEEHYRPEKVSLAELNDLLFRFHRLGLTVSDAAEQGDRLVERQRSERKKQWMQHLSGVLFIRLPGVDPEPLLKRLYPIAKPVLSAFGLSFLAAIAATALFVLASHWPRFASEFPEMQQWIQFRAVLILAAVIGVTKVLHELGHAIVCKHFGGECHQIGPMLLVFTPALYCDTSDSWTLPNRFARAAVGMAGIGTEIILASIATLVWASTGPTLVHYVAMNVMIVCSISTLLFNANPLLRYDGYYVLSDLCDVPNLGQKSRGILSRFFGKFLFGVQTDDDANLGRPERFWLTVYAFSAFVYRWTLTLLILWFILLMLRPYRLESVGWTLCIFAAVGLLFTTLRSPIAFLRHPGRRKLIRMNRVIKSGAVATFLIVLGSWPFPSGESASGRIVPRNETPVFVSTGGHLDSIDATAGIQVRSGDVLATLTNPEVELQFVKAKSRVQSQTELVQALQTSQHSLPDAANELPAAEAMLVELERQLETRQKRRSALAIRAPEAGRLIATPKRNSDSKDSQELTLARWSGDPTDRNNRGCFIESGTELFTVVTNNQWDAELIVSASGAQRIEPGNRVKLVLESAPSQIIDGTVGKVSAKQWNSLENGDRRDDRQATEMSAPVETSYAVRVQIDDSHQRSIAGLITGAEVSARVSSQPISLFGRTARFLNRLLRFR